MSYFPDMGCKSLIVSGDYIRAIGWLHPDHPYVKGIVSAEFLSRLKEFAERSDDSAMALYFGAFLGYHTCEFCGQSDGIGNFGVPSGDLLFVAPEMIVHYIEAHGYRPPAEFIEAVLRSPLPNTREYDLIAKPFRQRAQEVIERAASTAKADDDSLSIPPDPF